MRATGLRVGARLAIMVVGAIGGSSSAMAQDIDPNTSFVGPYAGPEIGLHEHHFYLYETNGTTGQRRGRYYRGWGVGGGAFVGDDFAIAPRLRLGVEAGVSVGGTGAEATFADGSYYRARPRYGFRATGRAGYLIGSRVMAYGSFGYGGHRYRPRVSANIAQPSDWGSSFTVGGGVEYRASHRIGVRLDFRHLDNQMSHLLIGIPIRF